MPRSGPNAPRWSKEKIFSSHGYVKIRVGKDHPLADPNGYAYEHLVVWVSAGNPRPAQGWLLHHKNEVKDDNRLGNLELKPKDTHGVEHVDTISDADVVSLREAYATGKANSKQLAGQFGLTFQTVCKILKGQRRKRAGGPIAPSGHLRTGRPSA